MATSTEAVHPARPVRDRVSVVLPRWSAAAWASIVLVLVFVATTCWWLSQDRSIPVYDAGRHLGLAIDAYESLTSGHLARAFTESLPYPPLTYLVGAMGIFVGRVGVAPPIIAANLVFVPLLALGCYQVGRLAFSPLAGLLAVVFALGSPLVIEEFHEFMLDAPEAAMVAIAVWAILATERFSRNGVSALAGVAVGLGMLSKETFVFFVAGVVLVTALRGGPHAWRGIALFAAGVMVTALPWYLLELPTIRALGGGAVGPSGSPSSTGLFPGVAPPRLSRANLEWYFWSILNWQLYAPLFAFSAVGFAWTMIGFARRRPVSGFAVELAVGTVVSWVALTETYLHDDRYSIPMMVYLAVLGVGWVSQLARAPRIAMATTLVLIALANSLGVGFGVARSVRTTATNETYEQQPGTVTFFLNHGLWIGAPTRNGDMLGLLRSLRRNGVRDVRWISEQESDIEYSFPGIAVLAQIAGLSVPSGYVDPETAGPSYAFLRHGLIPPGYFTSCIRLREGAGVWVRLGGARGVGAWGYCPLHG